MRKMTEVVAKYKTVCKFCNQPIEVGAIMCPFNSKWYHKACAEILEQQSLSGKPAKE